MHGCYIYIITLFAGEHVPKCEDGAEVYLQLRILLYQTDKRQFCQLLTQFMSYLLHQGLNRFHEYFRAVYCSRVPSWAPCYREHSIVNTNMFLENFHQLLKTVYREGKQNRRAFSFALPGTRRMNVLRWRRARLHTESWKYIGGTSELGRCYRKE